MIAVILILVLPRNKVITPFLFAFFTIPVGEVLVLGGFHFTALRVLILAGLARRAAIRKSAVTGKFPGGFNAVDKAVVFWSVSAVVALCLVFMELPAVINALGVLLDTMGGYFVVRSLIVDGEGVQRTIKTMALICTVLGICMINEQINHINVFGILGGISREVTVRDGKIRASGSLGCLYAGAFSGVLIPLFIWIWREHKSKLAAIAGIAGATAMVITSNSSTSWMALFGGLFGMAMWPIRKKMRLVRLGIVFTLVGLQIVMKAPVWALIARIDFTGSSSGFQRYMLVDMTIRHFSEWWLMGCTSYINWGWDSWDLCNQFVAVALTGGLFTLICYIAIFSRGFRALGKARRLLTKDFRQEWLLWCLGSALFATIVAHFGINYMAQLIMGFFPLVASISVASFEATRSAARASQKLTLAPALATEPVLAPVLARQRAGIAQKSWHSLAYKRR
ncbi:MAG TPA: hypothetical protein VHX60_02390 [Acidobacteriaceae bacterium]|nr:hypothetical protein [Acidobacteriaceae bacterium]